MPTPLMSVTLQWRLRFIPRRWARFCLLFTAPLIIAGCGTEAIKLPDNFWDLVYRANFNKQQAQLAAWNLSHRYCGEKKPLGEKECNKLRNEYDDAGAKLNAVYLTAQTIVLSNQQLDEWKVKDKDKDPNANLPLDLADAWEKASDAAKLFMKDYDTAIGGIPGNRTATGILDVISSLPWGLIGTLATIQSTANLEERKAIGQQIGKMMWLTFECVAESANCRSSGGTSGPASRKPALTEE